MEPLLASAAPLFLRPAGGAIQTELGALLRNGSILAGLVLQTAGDGSLLLGIGRHRVPAQTDVQLESGRPFLARVERSADEVVLRVLDLEGAREPGLLRALRSVVGHERPVGEILRDLAASLRAQLGATKERPPVLGQLQQTLTNHTVPERTTAEALQRLLLSSGLRYEPELARALQNPQRAPGLLAALKGDFKGELLRILGGLEEGPLREAVTRALAGLEAEQLLNLARQRAGEPFLWSLPLADGAGWATLSLFVQPRDERGEGESAEDGEASTRVVLGLSFQNTGPIRIDLYAAQRALTVSIVVTREEVAQRVRSDAEQLARILERPERPVSIVTRVGSAAEAEVQAHPLDTRFLRDHRLMDVSG